MREGIKMFWVLVILASLGTSFFGWVDDRPSPIAWALRIGGLVAAAIAFGVFLKMHFRADVVPDYLRKREENYFNRGGFCFSVRPVKMEDACFFDVWFQNQHEKPCIGRIVLRPARGFFLTRASIQALGVEIHAPAASFGVARLAVPVPHQFQGTRQSFEIGASVVYPQGKGRLLRFHDGLVVRSNSEFGNAFGTTLTAAGLLGGQLILSKPATVTFALPGGVVDSFPKEVPVQVEFLWKLGDPPLELPA